ncbi:unnamed protein product [Lactuca saligna]|uniref:Smr domain-containing protein n=1 Tax=Lactuca saligna TaxID=75948 RepID=A0AA35Y9J3_LACSI|nr:unnamed protein product [Lactuca saligna]
MVNIITITENSSKPTVTPKVKGVSIIVDSKEEILRPALERDLARNKKLESFKLIELRHRDRQNPIKINLSDQSTHNAICLIDIHLWIAFNMRTLRRITIISGTTNHKGIGDYLFAKDVKIEEKPGVFEITFFLKYKDYNFDNEMDWVDDQTNSWESVLEALLRCGQLYVGVNPLDIRRNLEMRDLIQDLEQIERRANSLVEEASKYYNEGSLFLGNQKMDEAENLRKEIEVEDEKNYFKLLLYRNMEITNKITIDLHGQFRYEAMWFLKLHLWLFNNLRTGKEIVVITGHAEDRETKPVLKPMVIGLLKRYGIEPKELNKGTFVITLPSEARDFNFALDISDCLCYYHPPDVAVTTTGGRNPLCRPASTLSRDKKHYPYISATINATDRHHSLEFQLFLSPPLRSRVHSTTTDTQSCHHHACRTLVTSIASVVATILEAVPISGPDFHSRFRFEGSINSCSKVNPFVEEQSDDKIVDEGGGEREWLQGGRVSCGVEWLQFVKVVDKFVRYKNLVPEITTQRSCYCSPWGTTFTQPNVVTVSKEGLVFDDNAIHDSLSLSLNIHDAESELPIRHEKMHSVAALLLWTDVKNETRASFEE